MTRLICVLLTFLTSAVCAQADTQWNSFGRLDLAGRGLCSATLVADDLALTAAHCLFRKTDGAPLPINQLSVHFGVLEGKAQATRKVAAIAAHPAYQEQLTGNLSNMRHDLAVLHLDAPVSRQVAQPLKVSSPDLTRFAESISFLKGQADVPNHQQKCLLKARPEGVFVTDCLSEFGASGAPLVQRKDGQLHVVSVISAKARADGQPISLAVSPRGAMTILTTEITSLRLSGRF